MSCSSTDCERDYWFRIVIQEIGFDPEQNGALCCEPATDIYHIRLVLNEINEDLNPANISWGWFKERRSF